MCSRSDVAHLAPDPWFPKGDRPLCRHCGAKPVYLGGLCGSCYSADGWAAEHRATRGDHYGLAGPGSSASTLCPMCGGHENSPTIEAERG